MLSSKELDEGLRRAITHFWETRSAQGKAQGTKFGGFTKTWLAPSFMD